MRRAGMIAMLAVIAGCGEDGPKPGGIYVLDRPAGMHSIGYESGERLELDPGSIVRVIEVGESSMGHPFVRVHVERGVEDSIFGDDTTGESGYIAAGDFSGSPSAAP